LTCLENVEVPMMALGVPRGERKKRARELLKAVGMDGRAGHRPTQVSGGERQRVAVARALANRPAVILADEPTGNLDSRTGEEVMALILELRRKYTLTLMVVTHNLEIARRADRTIELRDGRLTSQAVSPTEA
ncbi:MAG: ATP-binding cassette domain-containing protein, partial [Gemmatales bacterium]|nr:ATP-binding cassette domain-containing protein [Gemmatales bacterium]MDW8224399.1 ATP-binding cassette domain-containing protein [Gemmatales bacterium]